MTKFNYFKIFSMTTLWSFLCIFSLIPLLFVFVVSFLQHDFLNLMKLPFTLKNYFAAFNTAYAQVLLTSLETSSLTSLICLIIGYPFAYYIARIKHNQIRTLLLLLVIIPFWTSSLIRTYAMLVILKAKGIVNTVLLALGIIHQPIQLLYSDVAVLVGLVYNLLPFMILPLYAVMEKLDDRYIEAARDLGANRVTIFLKVILPLTMPGIIAGINLVFLPAMTLFYIQTILGGAKSYLVGNLIESHFLGITNWPMGAAISVLLLIVMLGLVKLYRRFDRNSNENSWL